MSASEKCTVCNKNPIFKNNACIECYRIQVKKQEAAQLVNPSQAFKRSANKRASGNAPEITRHLQTIQKNIKFVSSLEYSFACLRQFVVDQTTAEEMVELGAIEILYDAVRRYPDNENLSRLFAELLGRCSCNANLARLIAEKMGQDFTFFSGALQRFLSPETQEALMSAMGQLGLYQPNVQLMERAGIVPLVIGAVQRNPNHAKLAAAASDVLSLFVQNGNTNSLQVIMDSNVLDLLFSCLGKQADNLMLAQKVSSFASVLMTTLKEAKLAPKEQAQLMMTQQQQTLLVDGLLATMAHYPFDEVLQQHTANVFSCLSTIEAEPITETTPEAIEPLFAATSFLQTHIPQLATTTVSDSEQLFHTTAINNKCATNNNIIFQRVDVCLSSVAQFLQVTPEQGMQIATATTATTATAKASTAEHYEDDLVFVLKNQYKALTSLSSLLCSSPIVDRAVAQGAVSCLFAAIGRFLMDPKFSKLLEGYSGNIANNPNDDELGFLIHSCLASAILCLSHINNNCNNPEVIIYECLQQGASTMLHTLFDKMYDISGAKHVELFDDLLLLHGPQRAEAILRRCNKKLASKQHAQDENDVIIASLLMLLSLAQTTVRTPDGKSTKQLNHNNIVYLVKQGFLTKLATKTLPQKQQQQVVLMKQYEEERQQLLLKHHREKLLLQQKPNKTPQEVADLQKQQQQKLDQLEEWAKATQVKLLRILSLCLEFFGVVASDTAKQHAEQQTNDSAYLYDRFVGEKALSSCLSMLTTHASHFQLGAKVFTIVGSLLSVDPDLLMSLVEQARMLRLCLNCLVCFSQLKQPTIAATEQQTTTGQNRHLLLNPVKQQEEEDYIYTVLVALDAILDDEKGMEQLLDPNEKWNQNNDETEENKETNNNNNQSLIQIAIPLLAQCSLLLQHNKDIKDLLTTITTNITEQQRIRALYAEQNLASTLSQQQLKLEQQRLEKEAAAAAARQQEQEQKQKELQDNLQQLIARRRWEQKQERLLKERIAAEEAERKRQEAQQTLIEEQIIALQYRKARDIFGASVRSDLAARGPDGQIILRKKTRDFLQAGSLLFKYNAHGIINKSKKDLNQRHVFLSSDCEWLCWKKPGKDVQPHQRIHVTRIFDVEIGTSTEPLKRLGPDGQPIANPDRCFSIFGANANKENRTLDLEARSTDERDTWVKAIRELMEWAKEHRLYGSETVQMVDMQSIMGAVETAEPTPTL